MFEGFLKPKFITKCKGALKLTKTRIDAIRKKRRAVERFTKDDVSELLRTGFDYNAYGRAEGLLIERDKTACYDLLDQYCNDVLMNLSIMQKQMECPEECREAVASLLYSAARFADLPELRELRTLFTSKYGRSIETFTSKELVQKLKGERPSKEVKLQLVHDIAHEFGIDWDSKALEQRLFKPPPVVSPQVDNKQKEPGLDYNDDTLKWFKSKIASFQGRENYSMDSKLNDVSETKESNEASQESAQMTCLSSVGSSSDEDALDGKLSDYGLVPPAYIRPKSRASSSENVPVPETRPRPRSVRTRSSNPSLEIDEKAEEEKAIDDLLMHYSSKGINGMVPPERTHSLPAAQASREHVRDASMQPEILARHVHPRMPEYDDLAARLAALRVSRAGPRKLQQCSNG